MAAKFSRVESDLKEYVEDVGIVGHNISVLQKELSRLPDDRESDKHEKVTEMGKELHEARDYCDSLKQLFTHLEEDLHEGLPSEQDTETVQRLLSQYPQDGQKEAVILRDALAAFQTSAQEKHCVGTELSDLKDSLKLTKDLITYLQNIQKKYPPSNKKNGQKSRSCCC